MDKKINFWHRFFRHRAGNISLIFLIAAAILTLSASYIASQNPTDTDMKSIHIAPHGEHLLGTDDLGRDVFSRLLHGGQVSLLVGISSVVLSTSIGILFGLLSGYAGGIVDTVLMRIIDGLLSIPTLVLVVAFQAIGNQGLLSVVLVIAFTTWMHTARIVRTEFLSVKQRPFVKAALSCGAPDFKIVFRHILPNCMASVIVLATINVGHAIVTEAALSFLGMGIPPHQPSWGNMLMGGQRSILAGAWWITFFPGLMIVATVLATNFVGDAVRDALDPRQRGGDAGGKTFL